MSRNAAPKKNGFTVHKNNFSLKVAKNKMAIHPGHVKYTFLLEK